MGRINYCDVCHPLKDVRNQKEFLKIEKVTVSKFRSSIKNRLTGIRVALDLCEEHKHFLKDCKTAEEAQRKVELNLWGWADRVSDAIETAKHTTTKRKD